MMLVDVIHEADTEHEINFLLTAYVESLRWGDQFSLLPERMTTLPLAGQADIQERFRNLLLELDKASRQLDNRKCLLIKEALYVFGSALHRLSCFTSDDGSATDIISKNELALQSRESAVCKMCTAAGVG